MIFTLFIHVHKFPIKHMCWHSITKIHRNGPRAHFPFKDTQAEGVLGELDRAIFARRP
jgi:hypothetical protein